MEGCRFREGLGPASSQCRIAKGRPDPFITIISSTLVDGLFYCEFYKTTSGLGRCVTCNVPSGERNIPTIPVIFLDEPAEEV